MLIEAFSLTELGVFVGSCCASFGGLIFAISKSRCTRIECCCMNCDRDVSPIINAQELLPGPVSAPAPAGLPPAPAPPDL